MKNKFKYLYDLLQKIVSNNNINFETIYYFEQASNKLLLIFKRFEFYLNPFQDFDLDIQDTTPWQLQIEDITNILKDELELLPSELTTNLGKINPEYMKELIQDTIIFLLQGVNKNIIINKKDN